MRTLFLVSVSLAWMAGGRGSSSSVPTSGEVDSLAGLTSRLNSLTGGASGAAASFSAGGGSGGSGAMPAAAPPYGGYSTESYDAVDENPFVAVVQHPLSTFAADVDTASYSNLRRFLMEQNILPPAGAVRTEELVNYFAYDYPAPGEGDVFSMSVDAAECPWQAGHRLLRIGVRAKDVALEQRPAMNLVFLLDVSGSMGDRNKLELIKETMPLLVELLTENDRVGIVTYSDIITVALPSTNGSEKAGINAAIASLVAGGSTNGGAGIQTAYQMAVEHFIEGGVNRVILCTDGDFNVGMTSQGELVQMIREQAASGVFLTVLGFGMGNYKDSTLQKLADEGNGVYAYIDNLDEAKKTLVDGAMGTLVTVAKDVKFQVEFNPARIKAYRLIGYESRRLEAEEFNDNATDAGDIGAGHTVTALYQLVPVGVDIDIPGVDELIYQEAGGLTEAAGSEEICTLKVRYKEPAGVDSTLVTLPVTDNVTTMDQAPADLKFIASVASFSLLLNESRYKGTSTFEGVLGLANQGLGPDAKGYRAGFIELVQKCRCWPVLRLGDKGKGIMAERRAIVAYLDGLLKIAEIKDVSCNGLQVEGAASVRRVGLAVDACLAVFERAVAAGCQMVVVHHGMIWGGLKAVRGTHGRQIRYLLKHDVNLYAVHLPLDLHPQVGNNAQLARLLRLRRVTPFGMYEGRRIGYAGALPRPAGVRELSDALQAKLGGRSILLPFGKARNRTVAIVSGGGGDELGEAVDKGIDCYITGESVHWNHHWARENRVNVIYLGHYHSETVGVKAVGERLSRRFRVETVFLDEPTVV